MAAGTACSDASVAHFSTFEAGGRAMTSLTGRGRCYMVSRFTFGRCTVVAAGAASGDACVIKLGTLEACCAGMASFTASGRFYMA